MSESEFGTGFNVFPTSRAFWEIDQEQKPERLADQLLPRFGARRELYKTLEVGIGRQGAHVSVPNSSRLRCQGSEN